MDCIFCKIVKGEIESVKIWEDNDVLAFLDVFPVTRGHALIIPKHHAQDIFDVSEDMLQKITVTAKRIAAKVKSVLQADGIRLSQSSGKAAGQEVMHFHLHIIPRYEGDGVHMDNHGGVNPTKADMQDLKQLAQQLNSKYFKNRL